MTHNQPKEQNAMSPLRKGSPDIVQGKDINRREQYVYAENIQVGDQMTLYRRPCEVVKVQVNTHKRLVTVHLEIVGAATGTAQKRRDRYSWAIGRRFIVSRKQPPTGV